jgi:hypothetical protein
MVRTGIVLVCNLDIHAGTFDLHRGGIICSIYWYITNFVSPDNGVPARTLCKI